MIWNASDQALLSDVRLEGLRARWLAQLQRDLTGLPAEGALRLITQRAAAAPGFTGFGSHKARARELQGLLGSGNAEAIDLAWDEARRWLDASQVEGAAADQAPETAPRAAVLIVDDDPVQRLVLQRQVNRLGFEAVCADDGRSGLKAGLARTYALILMDRVLPDIQGSRVLQALRENGVQTPAVLLSATHNEERTSAPHAATSAGEVATLLHVKPLPSATLKELLGKAAPSSSTA